MDMAKREKDQMTENRLKDYAGVLNKDQMTKFKEHRQSLKEIEDNYTNKDKAKDKYEDATPEERERMKNEAKEKRDQKQSSEE
jgi:hypothetical protein